MKSLYFCLSILFACLSSSPIYAQQLLSGRIVFEGSPVIGATVMAHPSNEGTITDINGDFNLSLPSGRHQLEIKFMGFKTLKKQVVVQDAPIILPPFQLLPDVLGLDEFVVSASRYKVAVSETPIIVNKIAHRIFEQSQSPTLAQGLSFSPGLRIENNCSNCGFTQVRMNGLPGNYTQLLLNNRPVLSALTGVYGLEIIPPAMLERVEVVNGGGSAVFGGNAIAGTINLITKQEFDNTIEIGQHMRLIGGERTDLNTQFFASKVNETGKTGVALYGNLRQRQWWDGNDDGFSELTEIKGRNVGIKAYTQLNDQWRLTADVMLLNEYRRGGSDFEVEPHQAAIAEELDHSIVTANVNLDFFSDNKKHRTALYASGQYTNRASYYGAGGRVIAEGDSISAADITAMNAYGNATDQTAVFGVQHTYYLQPKFTLLGGAEWLHSNVNDETKAYNRSINQTVTTTGLFAQADWRATAALSIQAGARLDVVNIQGNYSFETDAQQQRADLPMLVPRLAAKYDLTPHLKLRASWAQGYRAPQAFDEDLHIETVGGAARFIRLDPNLQAEGSNAFNFGLEWFSQIQQTQLNLVFTTFYTQLQGAFVIAEAEELPSGISVLTKRNGGGANVYGINTQVNLAVRRWLIAQMGLTTQQALFANEEVLWSDENTQVATNQLLRTPSVYGYAMLNFNFKEHYKIDVSNVLTGPMQLSRLVDVNTEQPELVTTSWFSDLGLQFTYCIEQDKTDIDISLGISNMFNSFQRDLETGIDRDASYVYGPLMPRTYGLGLKIRL